MQNSGLNKKFNVLSVEWVLTYIRKHICTEVCREMAAAYFHFVVNVYFVIKVRFAASFFPESFTLLYIYTRDVTRSRGTRSCEIRLVLRERDDILAKYCAMFTLELHPAVIPT